MRTTSGCRKNWIGESVADPEVGVVSCGRLRWTRGCAEYRQPPLYRGASAPQMYETNFVCFGAVLRIGSRRSGFRPASAAGVDLRPVAARAAPAPSVRTEPAGEVPRQPQLSRAAERCEPFWTSASSSSMAAGGCKPGPVQRPTHIFAATSRGWQAPAGCPAGWLTRVASAIALRLAGLVICRFDGVSIRRLLERDPKTVHTTTVAQRADACVAERWHGASRERCRRMFVAAAARSAVVQVVVTFICAYPGPVWGAASHGGRWFPSSLI
jgi:hypothetical protein